MKTAGIEDYIFKSKNSIFSPYNPKNPTESTKTIGIKDFISKSKNSSFSHDMDHPLVKTLRENNWFSSSLISSHLGRVKLRLITYAACAAAGCSSASYLTLGSAEDCYQAHHFDSKLPLRNEGEISARGGAFTAEKSPIYAATHATQSKLTSTAKRKNFFILSSQKFTASHSLNANSCTQVYITLLCCSTVNFELIFKRNLLISVEDYNPSSLGPFTEVYVNSNEKLCVLISTSCCAVTELPIDITDSGTGLLNLRARILLNGKYAKLSAGTEHPPACTEIIKFMWHPFSSTCLMLLTHEWGENAKRAGVYPTITPNKAEAIRAPSNLSGSSSTMKRIWGVWRLFDVSNSTDLPEVEVFFESKGSEDRSIQASQIPRKPLSSKMLMNDARKASSKLRVESLKSRLISTLPIDFVLGASLPSAETLQSLCIYLLTYEGRIIVISPVMPARSIVSYNFYLKMREQLGRVCKVSNGSHGSEMKISSDPSRSARLQPSPLLKPSRMLVTTKPRDSLLIHQKLESSKLKINENKKESSSSSINPEKLKNQEISASSFAQGSLDEAKVGNEGRILSSPNLAGDLRENAETENLHQKKALWLDPLQLESGRKWLQSLEEAEVTFLAAESVLIRRKSNFLPKPALQFFELDLTKGNEDAPPPGSLELCLLQNFPFLALCTLREDGSVIVCGTEVIVFPTFEPGKSTESCTAVNLPRLRIIDQKRVDGITPSRDLFMFCYHSSSPADSGLFVASSQKIFFCRLECLTFFADLTDYLNFISRPQTPTSFHECCLDLSNVESRIPQLASKIFCGGFISLDEVCGKTLSFPQFIGCYLRTIDDSEGENTAFYEEDLIFDFLTVNNQRKCIASRAETDIDLLKKNLAAAIGEVRPAYSDNTPGGSYDVVNYMADNVKQDIWTHIGSLFEALRRTLRKGKKTDVITFSDEFIHCIQQIDLKLLLANQERKCILLKSVKILQQHVMEQRRTLADFISEQRAIKMKNDQIRDKLNVILQSSEKVNRNIQQVKLKMAEIQFTGSFNVAMRISFPLLVDYFHSAKRHLLDSFKSLNSIAFSEEEKHFLLRMEYCEWQQKKVQAHTNKTHGKAEEIQSKHDASAS